MYDITIANLRSSIEQHQVEGRRASVKAFAERYGFSRQNLVEVLGGNQELSVGLFLRLDAALKGKEAPAIVPGLERWSLRTWLQVDGFAVQQAMYNINFAN